MPKSAKIRRRGDDIADTIEPKEENNASIVIRTFRECP